MKNAYIDDKVIVNHEHIGIVTGVYENKITKVRKLKVRFVFNESCNFFGSKTIIINQSSVLIVEDEQESEMIF